ncbi:MAG: S8 family serine peptidase [Microcella sp.]
MKRHSNIAALVIVLTLAGCSPDEPPAEPPDSRASSPAYVHVGLIDGAVNVGLTAFDCLEIEQRTTGGVSGGHGTSVAAVVLGVGDGECRANDDVVVTSYPVLDERNGGATAISIASAIDQAVEDRVQLLNISIDLHGDDARLRTSVERAAASGVIIIAAAGNRAGLGAGFPAAYDSVISVGALNSSGELAPFSAASGLDVAAVGVDVQTIDGSGNPVLASGTSMASAAIAQVCIEVLRSGQTDRSEVLEALSPYGWGSP